MTDDLDVKKIVIERLEKDGYDGLQVDDGEESPHNCACFLRAGYFMPCGSVMSECKPFKNKPGVPK